MCGKTPYWVKAQPCVVVNLLDEDLIKYVYCGNAEIYNHSGDDGKEDPPVPIPNTEVKLFYAESTCG